MIKPIRYTEILDAKNSPEILREYAEECVVPDYKPQRWMYKNMNDAGILNCIGAFDGEVLIGFVVVISAVMPHNGKKIATIESIFVMSEHRSSGAGLELIEATESLARELDCTAILASPRIASRMEKVLSRLPKWDATHTAFTKWL